MWELCNSEGSLCNVSTQAFIHLCGVRKHQSGSGVGMSLNLVACAFIAVWMIEFLGYNAGRQVHYLLAIGILLVVTRLLLLFPPKRRA
jgi:predicted ferric reductase